MNLRYVEMRFILLAAFLLTASNSYAEINKSYYIFTSDSNELKLAKEELKIARDRTRQIGRMNFLNGWRNGRITSSKSETVYKVGDKEKIDIGAKIGMSKEEVLNKTYWGKPDNSSLITDSYGKLESWNYDNNGTLFFENDYLIDIF